MKGYFRKRSNGKWSFTIDVGIDPKTGKRKQKTVSGFNSEQEARNEAIKLQYELLQGTYIEEKSVLFKDFALQWLESYSEANDVKPGTIRVRKHEIGNLMPYLANLKVKDITLANYQQALNDLKEKGYADNTLSGIHRTGRMIFRKAREREIIKKDPTEFAYVKRTKKTLEELEQQELPNYLEKEKLALFLKTVETKGLEMDDVIFSVLSYTGMRVGELVALKWKDIDFTENTISITKTYYNPMNNTKSFQLVTPKTKKSRRKIIVDEFVMSRLRKHLTFQNEMKMLLRDTYHDEGFVFAKYEKDPGYPIFVKTVENRMKRILKLAGLNTELTPHSLRHTHTSLLAEAGVSLEMIMDRLGHSDDQTTKNVYLHVTETAKKEASQKFSELMRSFMN
jgi:integrase